MVYYSKQGRRLAVLDRIRNILLEAACTVCRQPCDDPDSLCRHCLEIVKNQKVKPHEQCLRCGLELSCHEALECAECLSDPPPFTRTVAALRYGPTAQLLVNQLKHQQQLHCLRPMTGMLIEAIAQRSPDPAQHIDLLVPVPLPPGRLVRRGFNQALELARPLARHFGLAIDSHCCRVIGEHLPRQQLGARQRRACRQQRFAAGHAVAGKQVAIVDDVVTTTGTARAVGAALLAAGASRCELWCFARTPKDR